MNLSLTAVKILTFLKAAHLYQPVIIKLLNVTKIIINNWLVKRFPNWSPYNMTLHYSIYESYCITYKMH